MIPMWLDPPPHGLSEAERRVLEAYFVGHEAKRAAALLSLAPKTINNELLSARQTMGESKSWVAAVRYVFYVKRSGMSFAEPSLFNKIETQIRRLLDDYLEVQVPVSPGRIDQALLNIEEPDLDERIGRSGHSIEVFGSGHEVPADEFERELEKLTECASLIYDDGDGELRQRRTFTVVVMLATLVGLALALLFTFRVSTSPNRDNYASIGDKLDRLQGDRPAVVHERMELAIQLSEQFHRELWGPNEESVRAVVDNHADDIRSVIKFDSKAALQILGNAHRAFAREGSPLKTEWFDWLEAAIQANKGTRDNRMVRALCGYVYGTLNDGLKAGKQPTTQEIEVIQRKRTEAAQLAVEIVDRTQLADYAEALRHLAMASPTSKRLAYCQQAFDVYRRIRDPRGKRGQAQCLLSIAQSGSSDKFLARSLRAFDFALPLGNFEVSRECVGELEKSLKVHSEDTETILKIRERLWAWATQVSDLEKFEALAWCLAIDSRLRQASLGEDIEALISFDVGKFDPTDAAKLAGFVCAEGRRTGRPVLRRLSAIGQGSPERDRAFVVGQKMSMGEAVSLAKAPDLGGQPTTEE